MCKVANFIAVGERFEEKPDYHSLSVPDFLKAEKDLISQTCCFVSPEREETKLNLFYTLPQYIGRKGRE